MKLIIFGLTISSSWGNGHATLWRGLVRELARRGHHTVFFEKDVPYYASHRDLTAIEGGELFLYSDFREAASYARRCLNEADAAMVTSYCPDGIEAGDLVIQANCLRIFYDMDTPVTLETLRAGRSIPYIGSEGLGGFDLVLSFTGGLALSELQTRLHARRVAPLYGSVDPEIHCRVHSDPAYRSDLSYLGTYSEDRQDALSTLFLDTARRMPQHKFLIGGSLYPQDFPWLPNTFYLRHVAPGHHASFYCSSRLTLNVTRRPMAQMGYCPSGRLFEAAACGATMISDVWEGIEVFFTPNEEILLAHTTDDVLDAMNRSDEELQRISRAARERVLTAHTAKQRAIELEELLLTGRSETAQTTRVETRGEG
jgi:spore maturation protein CgeB